MSNNGLVAELSKLILMDNGDARTQSYRSALERLNLQHLAHWMPPILMDSRSYNGQEFIASLRSERRSLDDIASLSHQVPSFVQLKVNALLKVLYLNQRFRQAFNYPPGKRATPMIDALLIQYAYKILVDNAPRKYVINDLFAQASSQITYPLSKWMQASLSVFRNQFTEEWDNLKFIQFAKKRSDSVWIDDACRPEAWLTIESEDPEELAQQALKSSN